MPDIWDDYGDWNQIALTSEDDALRQKITGTDNWQPNHLTPSLRFILESVSLLANRDGRGATVLDFGCGLGRNAPLLRRFFQRVIGIDLPPMISRLKSTEAPKYDTLYDDMGEFFARDSADVVFDSVVFQHIIDAGYSRDLANAISNRPCFQSVVSLAIDGNEPYPVVMLKERGWAEVHISADVETFGTKHNLRLLRRHSMFTR